MNTPLDQNHVGAKFGVLFSDGVTLIPIAMSADGKMMFNTTDVISQAALNIDPRDENYKTAWMGVSSVDGVTPIPIYVDATGAVLVDN